MGMVTANNMRKLADYYNECEEMMHINSKIEDCANIGLYSVTLNISEQSSIDKLIDRGFDIVRILESNQYVIGW